MQDASVVINYDLAWTPIEPTQRAGRILRPWDSPRTVKLYTFIPTIWEPTELKSELLKISHRWENLMQRHGESRKLTDLPVLTADTRQEGDMPEFAAEREVVIESGSLALESADDEKVSSYYQHTSKLHAHREYAQNLNSDLVSALTYSGNSVLLYVLLKYQNKYHVLLYNSKNQKVQSPESEEILNLIECHPETEVALVEAKHVEKLSDACIRAWCKRNGISEEEVVRECTLYLKPESEGDSWGNWLKN